MTLSLHGYTPQRAHAFFDDLRSRLSHNAAIVQMSRSTGFAGMRRGTLTIDGAPREIAAMSSELIDERYLATMGVAVSAGRGLSADDRPETRLVAMVSESFARWIVEGAARGVPVRPLTSPAGRPGASPGGPSEERDDAIGRRITLPFSLPGKPPQIVEIVGVVPNLIISVETLEPFVLYLPMAQYPPMPNGNVIVRASGDVTAAKRELLGAVRQIDRTVAPSMPLTLEERLGRQMSAQQLGAFVLGALGVMALLLTALGTYVLAESMATLRLREMGVRAALGATRGQLGALLLAETGRRIGLGLALGLALAWWGAGTIRTLLFRVEPLDPVTLIGVALLIVAVGAAVSIRPALRAARVDVAGLLRQD